MMEHELYSSHSGVVSLLREESGDEELSVLATHTKVESGDEELSVLATHTKVESGDEELSVLATHTKVESGDEELSVLPRHTKVESGDEELSVLARHTKVESGDEELSVLPRHTKVESGDEEPSVLPRHTKVESGDEELSVLPRHTKVIVRGNNRTKSVLVGLQGVVKKAVGLGGWHWLVLKNGVEVKLQRNALSVLGHPTGNEVDDDHDFDNSSSGSDIGHKDHVISSSIEFHRPAKPRVRHTKPWIQSAPMKPANRSGYRDVRSIIHAPQSVNLARLDSNALRRYCKHFKLGGTNAYSTREQMLNIAQQHFVSQQPLNEVQVISEFVTAAAKRLKTDDSDTKGGQL